MPALRNFLISAFVLLLILFAIDQIGILGAQPGDIQAWFQNAPALAGRFWTFAWEVTGAIVIGLGPIILLILLIALWPRLRAATMRRRVGA